MKRGLRFRLAVTHALVASLAIAVVAIIVIVAGGRRFDSYLAQVRSARGAALMTSLTQTYRAPDGWDAAAIYALSQVARADNVDVAVYSPQGRLLFTVQGLPAGRGAFDDAGAAGATGSPGGTSASPPASAATFGSDAFDAQSHLIVVGGHEVGAAELYWVRNARTAADASYESALARSLVIAVLVAATLAFLISLLVSRRITAPLEELADAAEDAAGGNLEVRVAARGDDEVGALATAFNAMSDRLARDEQWRRDMTVDLSHELRAPLAAMQTRIEALEDGDVPATPENLRAIGTGIERLGRLLGALHSLIELESADLAVELEPLDLADVARGAMKCAEAAFQAKGVVLAGDLSPAVVKGDADRLLQAVANLLDNALKFTPEGGHVVVTVTSGDGPTRSAVLSGGSWARLAVADGGPGIGSADLPFVFDRFFRSDAARGTQGLGVGLAIARGLVEAQGGVIEAADRPEGGALLTVSLPETHEPLRPGSR